MSLRTAPFLLTLLVVGACDCDAPRRRQTGSTNASASASPSPSPEGDLTPRVHVPEALDGDPPLPGVAEPSEAAARRLRAAVDARGADYEPRTEHFVDGRPRFTNRLVLETSPYLLQHAHNPVNWFPWGPEAFERAREEDKPVLLSIGYSTCHWCHVMERESFEDIEIATFINQHFIAIKVDREERPDLDAVYMRAVQMMTGRGGWPMTVVLTPDREPFFGGTYFPARDGDRGARRGFLSILRELSTRYRTDPETALADARRLSERIAASVRPAPGEGVPDPDALVVGAQQLARRFDPNNGGFGRAPKFPQPSKLVFLMRYYRRTRDPGALHIVEHTLDNMARGGIYDHVGGGFHRYATDARWLVPHFEKMLYDNAQLATVYVEAWQLTGDERYRSTAEAILAYVRREMTSPEGGFYSATDADSLGPDGHLEEGAFFTWTPSEIRAATSPVAARVAISAFGVSDAGNFEGRNILHRTGSDAEAAAVAGMDVTSFREALAEAIADLYRARSTRPAPLRDDKILTSWNGLMISAFARAARAFGDDELGQTARRAALFVLDELRDAEGRLLRSYAEGRASHNAYLDDYAFLTAALLDTYEATGEARFLREALALSDHLDRHHLDAEHGAWFTTSDDHEELLVRDKPTRDGAIPSGNSYAIMNALRLALFTGDRRHRERAEAALTALSEPLRRRGSAMPLTLAALDFYYDVPLEVIVVHPSGQSSEALRAVVGRTHLPNALTLSLEAASAASQAELVPLLSDKEPLDDEPTAFVCERGRCQLPTTDATTLRRQLAVVRPLFEDHEPERLTVRRP